MSVILKGKREDMHKSKLMYDYHIKKRKRKKELWKDVKQQTQLFFRQVESCYMEGRGGSL